MFAVKTSILCQILCQYFRDFLNQFIQVSVISLLRQYIIFSENDKLNLSGVLNNNSFFLPCNPVVALDWLFAGKETCCCLTEPTQGISELLIL